MHASPKAANVQRMFTPMNYRVSNEAEVHTPAPVLQPDLNRDTDRRRRGSCAEGVAAKVNVTEPPKPGPGRSLSSQWAAHTDRAFRPPPTPFGPHSKAMPQASCASPRVSPRVIAGAPLLTKTPPAAFYAWPLQSPRQALATPAPLWEVPAWSQSQAWAVPAGPAVAAVQRQMRFPSRGCTAEQLPPAPGLKQVLGKLRQSHYVVCIVGGAEITGASRDLCESLAQEFQSRLPQSVSFAVLGATGVPQAFSKLFESHRLWNLEDVRLRRELAVQAFDSLDIMCEIGDVYVFIEDGPDACYIAQKARQRGAHLVPIRRGPLLPGAQRPSFVGAGCWALLNDPEAPAAATAAAASAVVAGALASCHQVEACKWPASPQIPRRATLGSSAPSPQASPRRIRFSSFDSEETKLMSTPIQWSAPPMESLHR